MKDTCALFKVPFVEVESSVAPRAALTQLIVGAAYTLEAVGLARSISHELNETGKELIVLRNRLRTEVSSEKNRAKQMASRLLERFVVLYSLQRMSSVARRFKNQLAENAKQVAKFDLLPEAGHNEVEAWHELDKNMMTVLIRGQAETNFERSAFQAFKSTLSTRPKTKSLEVSLMTRRGLSELLSPILLLDYVTVYLAILKGVDPTPTKFIEMYKARLRNR